MGDENEKGWPRRKRVKENVKGNQVQADQGYKGRGGSGGRSWGRWQPREGYSTFWGSVNLRSNPYIIHDTLDHIPNKKHTSLLGPDVSEDQTIQQGKDRKSVV